MTNPQRFLNRIILFLVLVLGVTGLVYQIIVQAFLHNPALNGLIIGVLLLGIVYTFRRILLLKPEIRWIEAFRTQQPGFSLHEPPRLLAPVTAVLGERERRGRASLNAMSMRYLLDSISARLDESREISRYLTGLLIFLGLLGTFWGLLETINSVGLVIANLSLGNNDMVTLFNEMKAGLSAPLSGMGTAFSSSLFGLAGSLVLGFLDLQANQAQNAFYNDLEEWLSTLTQLRAVEDTPALAGTHQPALQGAPLPTYVQAMLQQTAENLENLESAMQRSEDGRSQLNGLLIGLNDQLGLLNERLERGQMVNERLLETQEAVGQHLIRQAQSEGLDPASREHLRNLDIRLERAIDELSRGREEMTRELRQEIKLVSRTIALAAGEPNGAGP